jgi:hypothetical protein
MLICQVKVGGKQKAEKWNEGQAAEPLKWSQTFRQ